MVPTGLDKRRMRLHGNWRRSLTQARSSHSRKSNALKITKYGHSCLHVVDGSASILIDPGSFSQGFETLSGLTAVLVTHQHPDHVDPQRLTGLLRANPDATLYADSGSVEALAEAGITATPVATGDVLDVGTRVEVFAGDHAVVHRRHPAHLERLLLDRRAAAASRRQPDGHRPAEWRSWPCRPRRPGWRSRRRSSTSARSTRRSPFPIHEKVMANPAMVYGMLTKLGPPTARWLEPGRRAFRNPVTLLRDFTVPGAVCTMISVYFRS